LATDDRVASTLAGIREDIKATVAVYDLDGTGKNSFPVSAAMSRHARVLFAALEAALEEAADWVKTSAILDGKAERAIDNGRLSGPATSALLSGRAQAYQDCAQALREAITTALAGKETDHA